MNIIMKDNTLTGYIKTEPEMRFTPNGNAITTFILAKDSFSVDEENEKNIESRVITWNLLAEACQLDLEKYQKVFLKGYWKTRTWLNRDTQKEMSRQEFTANKIFLLDGTSEEMARAKELKGN